MGGTIVDCRLAVLYRLAEISIQPIFINTMNEKDYVDLRLCRAIKQMIALEETPDRLACRTLPNLACGLAIIPLPKTLLTTPTIILARSKTLY